MANIIDSLGADFINKRFVHAMFLKDGEPYRLIGCGVRGGVQCKRIRDGADVNVENDFFTGFKVFAYPKLGYRRMGNHFIGFCVKEQSPMRGLALDRVGIHPSPSTNMLQQLGFAKMEGQKERMIQIMRPVFDKKEDLPALFAGERSGVVLSESLVVEPSTLDADGHFDVLYDQIRVAKIDDKFKYTWTSRKYERFLAPLLAA